MIICNGYETQLHVYSSTTVQDSDLIPSWLKVRHPVPCQQNLKPVIVNKYSICSYYKCFVKKSNHFLQNMTKMMSTGCVKIYD